MRKIRIAIFVVACVSMQGQWLNNPTAGAPRTRDGKVNMTGPVGRVNGKPDLSGIWQVQAPARTPGGLFGIGESPNSNYFRDILSDYKPGEEPLTPEGAAIFRQRGQAGSGIAQGLNCLPDGVPHADLLPEPFKFIQTPGVIVMLYEVETTFRQIFMDGRKLPTDPSPTWNGYSVGKWEGDTLVIDTIGFNDRSWLDARGHGHSEEMRVEERFRRRDYGHLELTVTITDPKTFTKPVKFSVVQELLPDTDLFEHYCVENEKDVLHQPAPAAR
ncbi:MAG: hypothetical protein ABIR70_22815 [Bryobacteraceae bacterium]